MAKATTTAAGPELTTRSIIVGLVVAAIIGSAYPYCVLKLGIGTYRRGSDTGSGARIAGCVWS